MTALSFDTVRDGIASSPAFEGACKRYLRARTADTINAGGLAAGVPSENLVLNGADLDARIDAAFEMEI